MTLDGNFTTGVDFGNWQPAEIHGIKWNDLDGDGAPDSGEPGLAGWTIFLDANENGALDGGETAADLTIQRV